MVLEPMFSIVILPTEISPILSGAVVIPLIVISPATMDPIPEESMLLILILSSILIVDT